MDKIIWRYEYEDYKIEIYVRVEDGFCSKKTNLPKPYLEYVFGIRQIKPSWISQPITYVAEDGFVMTGNELLVALEKQIKSYKETKIKLYDHLQDTDAEMVFDCKKDQIILSGSLGNTTSGGELREYFKSSFKIEVDKEILVNLYNALMENSLK